MRKNSKNGFTQLNLTTFSHQQSIVSSQATIHRNRHQVLGPDRPAPTQTNQTSSQNRKGELLGHVRDTGADRADRYVRQYLTTQNIPFHCDAADMVGLLCLEKAKSGGLSRIASSVSVAQWIISPHLSEFTQSDPNIRLRFLSTIWPDDFHTVRADVEIPFGYTVGSSRPSGSRKIW